MIIARVFECVDVLIATFECNLSLCGFESDVAKGVCAQEFELE